MTDYYKLSLEMLSSILQEEKYDFWVDWMKKDIELWESGRSTEHHLHAYGGMGSFNDIIVGDGSIVGIWKGKLFGMLQTLAYQLAKEKSETPSFDEEEYRYGFSEIQGWRCLKCSHARINDIDIERYLVMLLFSKYFVEFLKDDLKKIFPLENIINSEEVTQKREKIRNLVLKSGIEIDNKDWLHSCPKCGSTDVCVYRWIVDETFTSLSEADNNLEIMKS